MIRAAKPNTRRAKRAIEKRESKIVENPKQGMFIRGHNTSDVVNNVLRDLYALKKPDGALLRKKNQILPFEDATSLEFLSQRNDASLFVLGSHTKKRPNNLVFGRFFNHQILDMLELGVKHYQPLSSFKTEKCAAGAKHCFLFNGEIFEQKEEFKQLKSLLLDFYRGDTISNVNLAGLDHVISVSASQEGKVYFRVYNVKLKKSGTKIPRVEVEEIGPSIDFEVGRVKAPAPDVMREALKVPRTTKPTKVKNVTTDLLGKKYGKIHMQKQDFDKMALRKMKGLKRPRKETEEKRGAEEGGKAKRVKTED